MTLPIRATVGRIVEGTSLRDVPARRRDGDNAESGLFQLHGRAGT
jgi:hypothetical protein